MRIVKRVSIIFVSSLHTRKILLNQQRQQPNLTQVNLFGNPNLVRRAPHACQFSRPCYNLRLGTNPP